MCRVDRLYDDTDDGACRRCGECCMVLTLESITLDQAERLGKEFCYPAEKYPGYYGIKKAHRNWEPSFAINGVCVFLFPTEQGFKCMAREDRPPLCSVFECVSTTWAARMDWKVLYDKLWVEKKGLGPDELARREAEVAQARAEMDRFEEFEREYKQRRVHGV